jgi:hypothetical protein
MRAFRLKALVRAVLTTRRSLPLLATVLLMPVGGVGANDDPARVLVLLPVSAELPAMQEIVRSLRETIESRSKRPVDIHVHAADFALFPSDRYQAVFADYTSYRHKLAFLERLEIQREQRVQLLLVRGMRLF